MRLMLGDCLDRMGEVEDGSVDLILADLPYGTTACKWDVIIPLEPLWAHYRRILKPRGAVVLTGCQPFTSTLVMSNPGWFKYCWAWEKNLATDFINAKNRPLRAHEDVLVFSPGTTANRSLRRMTFNPQGLRANPHRHHRPNPIRPKLMGKPRKSWVEEHDVEFSGYPRSVLKIACEHNRTVHPTQKPVALFEYLTRTYSNPGELVMDNAMGSGTTGIACLNTGRDFIGLESDPTYFVLASARLEAARPERIAS